MAAAGQLASSDTGPQSPASFLASAAALDTIGKALRAARHGARLSRPPQNADLEQALASLLLLRKVREQFAEWETTASRTGGTVALQ
ncbi:hypothetical protein ACFYXW_26675 [Streptomyces sp. NPDC001981]|uniref:hypothetical protein n=1 Tax=Streptomyces sp. NPDC001981 TaxID=3364628 RepID=UPI0036C9AEC7